MAPAWECGAFTRHRRDRFHAPLGSEDPFGRSFRIMALRSCQWKSLNSRSGRPWAWLAVVHVGCVGTVSMGRYACFSSMDQHLKLHVRRLTSLVLRRVLWSVAVANQLNQGFFNNKESFTSRLQWATTCLPNSLVICFFIAAVVS